MQGCAALLAGVNDKPVMNADTRLICPSACLPVRHFCPRIKLYMTMKVKHAIKKKAREAMERKQARNVMFGIVGVLFLLLVLGMAAYYFVQA